MKLSTIAKTSLALGILTTGVMTTYAQSADAAVQNVGVQIVSKEAQILHDYYSKTFWDLRNVNGEREGNVVKVIDKSQLTEVKLLGPEQNIIKDKESSQLDVFVVREGNGKQAPTLSINGITKTNKNQYYDYNANPPVTLTKKNDNTIYQESLGRFETNKEQITLKEIDFRLRQKLVKEKDLYKSSVSNGKIVVKMKEKGIKNDYYTFELNKKLQEDRMGVVINPKDIKEISIDI
ncbi:MULTISPECIES: superantigen-like protein [Staphylococcus]|uniref:Superantigen-like protein n=1 Tax=Staphylococcus agnetis TaxID=985762 RepID=A0A2T4MCJ7_9STAP|nr:MULTISPECIES: superantigen-like protein [Staphylococcus]NHM75566.1 superantigen-like protein [Staphylococcus sp. 11007852]NHM92575.1 superantigen-like protein [Staphylococcus sp. 10602379]NJI02181.1 superantigen-like protein [Staphylococcus agnetis]NJI12916.1 superantigen-like protein [Staphylococcus agnetis]PTH13299.1 superantigen-like protein [Staphylococcus agnetis]